MSLAFPLHRLRHRLPRRRFLIAGLMLMLFAVVSLEAVLRGLQRRAVPEKIIARTRELAMRTSAPAHQEVLEDGARAADDEPVVKVSDSHALKQALRRLRPGQLILLADGLYDVGEDLVLTTHGSGYNPIVLQAENRLGATLVRRLTLRGAHTVLSGLVLDHAPLVLDADRVRITRCAIRSANGAAVSLRGGHGARVDYCSLTLGGGVGIALVLDPNEPNRLRDVRIDHNLFKSGPQARRPTGVRLGRTAQHAGLSPAVRVDHNLFTGRLDGLGALVVEASDNLLSANTFLDCSGDLVLRHGTGNRVIANRFVSSSGLLVHGKDHEILGNSLRDSAMGLRLAAGDERALAPAEDVLLAGNEADRTIIGARGTFDEQPARNVQIEAHEGPITIAHAQGTETRRKLSQPIPPTVPLTLERVGPTGGRS